MRNNFLQLGNFPLFFYDDAKKIISELIVQKHANRVLEEQKDEEPIKSTNEVPAKDFSKVKSVIEESPITQKCEC